MDSGVECQQSMPSDTSSSHSSDVRWREVNEEAAVIRCMQHQDEESMFRFRTVPIKQCCT